MDSWQQVEEVERAKRINCKEYYKRRPGSRKVIVFIHGIIEGPKQFRRLAEIAYEEEYSSVILLLPGHGGSGKAFADTDFRQWVVYVSRRLAVLKRRYEEVILVGHSMGALFAVCEAVRGDKKIKAIILLDIPLKIRLWPRVIKSTFKILRGANWIKEKYILAEYKAISVSKAGLREYIKWVKRYIELLSIIRYTRKRVHYVKVPMLVVFAKKDEFVSPRSIKYFDNTEKSAESIFLEDSGHFAYHHSDLTKVEAAYRRFIGGKKENEDKGNV